MHRFITSAVSLSSKSSNDGSNVVLWYRVWAEGWAEAEGWFVGAGVICYSQSAWNAVLPSFRLINKL